MGKRGQGRKGEREIAIRRQSPLLPCYHAELAALVAA
jgi:hypothetical protein